MQQKENYGVLNGIIIAHHHTPTWWAAWNFPYVYSLWILWRDVKIRIRIVKIPGKTIAPIKISDSPPHWGKFTPPPSPAPHCYLETLGGGVFEVGGGGGVTPTHTMKLDALLHKIGIRIPRLNMCTPMTSLSKIAYQMWCDHPSIQRNKTIEWVGGWSKRGREGVDKIWKKREGRQYRGSS